MPRQDWDLGRGGGARRCGALGVAAAYVGSDQAFYLSTGFKVIYTTGCWVRLFGD